MTRVILFKLFLELFTMMRENGINFKKECRQKRGRTLSTVNLKNINYPL
uniref:Uncharacterized protein n=1 Tax=Meloidogyne enterolobii TaxID=390850 RepID=A0A6V7XYJ7_MELEN|nr:unnamed protein product [Meloidogyne enterolobii]